MRDVSAGEPILPRMTASWYNSTLKQPTITGVRQTRRTNHKDVVMVYNEASSVFDHLDPIAIKKKKTDTELNTHCIANGNLTEYNWGICVQRIGSTGSGEVVLAGLTLANVEIREEYHHYVNIKAGKCVSACHGKALLLAANENGPSLIHIGVRPPASGLAYTTESIPGRTGRELGGIQALLVELDELGEMVITEDQIDLYNTQTLPTSQGFVQWKEICGKKCVDVSPCEDDGSESI